LQLHEEELSRHRKVKGAQVQALRREFKSLQIKDGQFVTSYCDGTTEINNKMWIYGEKIEDVIAM